MFVGYPGKFCTGISRSHLSCKVRVPVQESHTEAAGQVLELSAEGRLLIRWADALESWCWPQELFLIGDDVSNGEMGERREVDTIALTCLCRDNLEAWLLIFRATMK